MFRKATKGETEIAQWMAERRMELDGPGGLVIDGAMVRDYCNLLRHVTNERLDSFRNFEGIYDMYPAIVGGIVKDMQNPLETERHGLELDAARANLKTLRRIVEVIHGYVERCRELGLEDRLQRS